MSSARVVVCAGAPLEGRKLRVAVVGGGPAGAALGQRLFGRCPKLHERTTDRCDGLGGAQHFFHERQRELPVPSLL